MNLAAILAMLLQTGLCAQTEFHGSDGSALRVVVCPVMQPAAAPGGKPEDAPDQPPAPPPPPVTPERHA